MRGALNPRFGNRILLTESGHYYSPGVFYCKDAFEGLSTMDALMHPEKRTELLDQIQKAADYELGKELSPQHAVAPRRKSTVTQLPDLPKPPYWGPRVVTGMPLAMVGEHLSLNELFRLSWGAKNAHGEEWKKLKAEFETRLAWMRKDAENEGWLKPQGVYGYWPANPEGHFVVYIRTINPILRSSFSDIISPAKTEAMAFAWRIILRR